MCPFSALFFYIRCRTANPRFQENCVELCRKFYRGVVTIRGRATELAARLLVVPYGGSVARESVNGIYNSGKGHRLRQQAARLVLRALSEQNEFPNIVT